MSLAATWNGVRVCGICEAVYDEETGKHCSDCEVHHCAECVAKGCEVERAQIYNHLLEEPCDQCIEMMPSGPSKVVIYGSDTYRCCSSACAVKLGRRVAGTEPARHDL